MREGKERGHDDGPRSNRAKRGPQRGHSAILLAYPRAFFGSTV